MTADRRRDLRKLLDAADAAFEARRAAALQVADAPDAACARLLLTDLDRAIDREEEASSALDGTPGPSGATAYLCPLCEAPGLRPGGCPGGCDPARLALALPGEPPKDVAALVLPCHATLTGYAFLDPGDVEIAAEAGVGPTFLGSELGYVRERIKAATGRDLLVRHSPAPESPPPPYDAHRAWETLCGQLSGHAVWRKEGAKAQADALLDLHRPPALACTRFADFVGVELALRRKLDALAPQEPIKPAKPRKPRAKKQPAELTGKPVSSTPAPEAPNQPGVTFAGESWLVKVAPGCVLDVRADGGGWRATPADGRGFGNWHDESAIIAAGQVVPCETEIARAVSEALGEPVEFVGFALENGRPAFRLRRRAGAGGAEGGLLFPETSPTAHEGGL